MNKIQYNTAYSVQSVTSYYGVGHNTLALTAASFLQHINQFCCHHFLTSAVTLGKCAIQVSHHSFIHQLFVRSFVYLHSLHNKTYMQDNKAI